MVQGIEQTYEGMFLVNAATAVEDWAGVMATIERVMERAEAEITRIEKWDERRLCYSVSGQKRGTYILCYFKSNPAAISKIERDVQLNETILRVLILRADQIPQLIQDIPTPYAQSQQQKQVVKVAADSDTPVEGDLKTEEAIGSVDDSSPSEDSVEVSKDLDDINEDDIPDILETFDDEDESVVPEKPRTDDIDETENPPS